MRGLARWCIDHRRLVAIGWIVVLIGANVAGASAGSTYNSNFKGQSDSGSQQALNVLAKYFPQRKGDSAEIVFESKTPLATGAARAKVDALLAQISGFPHVSGVVSPFTGPHQLAPDGRIGYATVLFDERSFQLPKTAIDRVINTAEAARSASLQVQLGGQPIEQVEPPSTGPATGVGIIAAIVILLITFGTVIAAGLPLITALLALGTAVGLIELLTHVMDVVNFTPELAAMIGLGVGIDYALFVVTRYRAGLDAGLETDEAIITAMDTSGRAVVFAGITVVIAMLGQLLVGVAFLRGPAVASSLTVLLTMLAAITLLPAVLSRLGGGIDRLDPFGMRRRQRESSAPTFWERWAGFVQRRPIACGLASLAVLLTLASPILALRLGATDAGTDAKSTTTYQAYHLLAKGFGPGSNGPMQVVVQLPSRHDVAAADTLRSGMSGLPDVAAVTPPTYSPDGRIAVINVIPKTTPRDAATSNLLTLLRDKVIPPLARRTGTVVYVGGTTALFADFSSYLAGKLPLFIGAVVLISAFLLLAVFRSVFVALKAIVMNLLSVGAAFGVVVAVFQWGWLGGFVGISTTSPIAAFLPVMVFAIVFGLSMDYEVFLMSRMHEEWERSGDAAYAMRHGLAQTGRVITAAAAIMVCVFASFILGNNLTIKLFGVGLASAVFLDAFVIRTVLVPSIMALMGSRAWWLPRGLDRALPRLHVEPGAAETAPEPA
ncbi:MAG: MMPL family transporter [Solirubrobacteraceae bacterium]|jgi:RND superfamily putative drug exporter